MENKIPTSEGDKISSQIMNSLYYASYKANRDEGVKHESLISIGIGNDAMKHLYENESCKCIRFVGGQKWYSNGCKIHPNG